MFYKGVNNAWSWAADHTYYHQTFPPIQHFLIAFLLSPEGNQDCLLNYGLKVTYNVNIIAQQDFKFLLKNEYRYKQLYKNKEQKLYKCVIIQNYSCIVFCDTTHFGDNPQQGSQRALGKEFFTNVYKQSTIFVITFPVFRIFTVALSSVSPNAM